MRRDIPRRVRKGEMPGRPASTRLWSGGIRRAPVQAREERLASVRAGGRLMCPGSDELLTGPLIDFHTGSVRENVLACSRVGRGAGVKTNMAGRDATGALVRFVCASR